MQQVKGSYSLFLRLVEQYSAVSYGDPTFSSFICTATSPSEHSAELIDSGAGIYLTAEYPVEYRKAIFSDLSRSLRLLAEVPPPLPAAAYLEPIESHFELLQLYQAAVGEGRVPRTDRRPSLYWILVHHTAGFVFADFGGADPRAASERVWLREQLLSSMSQSWPAEVRRLVSGVWLC